jgi:hypothetical protein
MRQIAAAIMAVACTAGRAQGATPVWAGFAANAQHTAPAPAAAQALSRILWQTPVDLDPQYDNGGLFIHYGSPMIAAGNTIVFPVKTGAEGGWEIQAVTSARGAALWTLASDYIAPSSEWIPGFPAGLSSSDVVYAAGAAGTVLYRQAPNKAKGGTGRYAFYGLSVYQANMAALTSDVQIDTPITTGPKGEAFFGFLATNNNPAQLASGIARITASGAGSWVGVAKASGDKTMTEIAINAAPALSPDGSVLYVVASNGASGYLLGLNSKTLKTEYQVALVDPASGQPAELEDLSSASPMVGPDGDVYYGVLENPYPNHDGRGWLLHFDATLKTLKTPGSFGWDDTASVVPSSAIPSYTGKSAYLLMTKYNNYYGVGPLGDGHNKIAILDPNATQIDEYTKKPVVMVMREVQTVSGATQYPGEPAGAVYEWCNSTSVVDAATGSAFAGSEDGHVYRWDLAGNTLSQSLLLNPPQTEAYTPTLVGANGIVYAIDNAQLFATGK